MREGMRQVSISYSSMHVTKQIVSSISSFHQVSPHILLQEKTICIFFNCSNNSLVIEQHQRQPFVLLIWTTREREKDRETQRERDWQEELSIL